MTEFLFIVHPIWYLILLGLWVYCLVDALRFHRTWFWVLFVLCLGPLAAIVYIPNFKLKRHRREGLLDEYVADAVQLKDLQQQAAESNIPALHLQVAEIHVRRQRWQEALEELDKALANDDEDLRAHHLAGVCFRELGRPEGALAHLEYVLGEDPRAGYGHARLVYANALLDLGRKEEAAEQYDRVLSAYSIPEAAVRRARLLEEFGERSAAMETLEDSIDRAKDFPADRKADEGRWIRTAREELDRMRKAPNA
ncbi:tetratricopeptide repeat protein [bacterium]|nr:tetratricopeptide repeat protein [bacterium]